MPRPTTFLTDKLIREALPPNGKSKRLYGSDGLMVDIKPSGNKYFYFRYSFAGKVRHMSLGRYPVLSLEKAREWALEFRFQVLKGIDPLEERKRKQASYKQALQAQENTFEKIAREWYERKRHEWKNAKHGQQVINTLSEYVFSSIGNTPITEITTPDLLTIIDRIAHKHETASRVKQRIKAVFDYAIQTGRATANPAASLPMMKRRGKQKNHPSLPYQELGEFLRRCDGYSNRKTALALRLLILTMTRSGELRSGKWEELHGDEWHIPEARMKNGLPHIVPLSDWALETLDELRQLNKYNSPYFVTGNRNTPISDMTLSVAMKRLGYENRAVPHGFRATASSCLNESGLWNADAIERQLAHKEQNAVRAAYNRAEYLEERKKMMQWYSNFIREQFSK